MMSALWRLMPWAHHGPGWATLAILISVVAAAATLMARENPMLKRVLGGLGWIAIFGVLIAGLRGAFAGALPIGTIEGDATGLIVSCGVALAGALAWILAGAAAIPDGKRRSLTPTIFVLLAAAIGVMTASDLLVLMIWQIVVGGSIAALVLLTSSENRRGNALSLFGVEATSLLAGGVALAVLGSSLPLDIRDSGAAAIGLAALVIALIGRLGHLISTFSMIARAPGPVLAAELCVAAIAVPAVLRVLVALVERYALAWPEALTIVLTILAVAAMLAGALFAIAARERGLRIASIAASLMGLAVLGACEGARTSLMFILLWLAPVPAYLAASSVAGRVDRGGEHVTPAPLKPQADAILILLALSCLALTGLPPFAGFWARLVLVEAAWAHADYTVVLVALLSSLLLAFALARRAFEPAPASRPGPRITHGVALPELLVLGIMSGFSIAGGIYPAPFMDSSDASPGARASIETEAG